KLRTPFAHRSDRIERRIGMEKGTIAVVVNKTFLDVVVPEHRGLNRTNSWPSLQSKEVEAVVTRDLPTLKADWIEDQIKISQAMKAAVHRDGKCFPCLFFTRKGDGCRQGDNCTHCHICTVGEARRRRNRISLEMRKAKRSGRKEVEF
ncbi:Uncharacterized protein SCF082_LOCUS46542, partial [Durusdinium trenchii]